MPFPRPEDEQFPSLGYDVDRGASSTAFGAPYAPPIPPPAAPPPIAPQKPAFNAKVGLPVPPSPVAPTQQPMAPTGPDPMQEYLNRERQKLSEFGPDKQMELEQAIQKRRSGLGSNLANAGAGLADAIMQGVARAGSSNFQSNLQGRLDKSDEAQRSALEKQQSGGLAKMKQEMELASMDPASPISRSTQRAHMVTLKGMGYTPEDAAAIPANAMPDVLSKRISLEEIREKSESDRLQKEQNEIALGIRQQSAEQAARSAKEGGEREALKQLGGMPFYSRMMHPGIAGKLKQQAGLESPEFSTPEEAEAAGLAPGTRVVINGRPALIQ